MGNTPWYLANNDVENPSVYCSKDGLTWQVPPGVTNPLDFASGDSYNSDPEMIYVDDTLYLVWRRSGGLSPGYHMRSTKDGVTWSPRQYIGDDPSGMSPSLHWDGTNFHRWSVIEKYRGVGEEFFGSPFNRWRNQIVYETAPTLSGPWTPLVVCNIRRGVFASDLPTDPWHIGVTKYNGVYHMIGGVGEVGWGGSGPRAFLAASSDGVNWNVDSRYVMLTEPGTWQSKSIYRPTMLIENGKVRVWYSAQDPVLNKTGYCEMPLAYLLRPL